MVVGLWLLVLAATFPGSSATGSNYAQSTTLSGTPSAAAAQLLQQAVPGQSGDTEQIVFQAKTGTVDSPAVESQITRMLGQVSHLPYVSSVTSPYVPAGVKQVSAGSLVGVTTGPVDPFIPILMFAVLFGLTTDYQVFLVSRIQEEWLRRRENTVAVLTGQAATGRIITAAAAIMTVVFFSFTLTTDRDIKMIGLGMAAAVVTDALIVRTVLVPAVMHMLGKTNWRIPRALDGILPRLDLDGGSETEEAASIVAAEANTTANL